MEAMGVGLPVIITNATGQTEYLSSDVAYPIAVQALAQTPHSDPWLSGARVHFIVGLSIAHDWWQQII